MLAFDGIRVPSWVRERLAEAPVAGFTLFRPLNVRSPRQVRALTKALQAAAGMPLLIAVDQEGGQLMALGPGWTPFAGPMAIGATADPVLAERVGRAIGLELRAVGVNVNYAPVMDLANATNLAQAIRSFGDDPGSVARLGTAWARGVQSAGVVATLKHFPGAGGVGVDTHHALAIIDRSRADLEIAELRPFREAIAGGARMVMSGHFASPALTGSRVVPATLAGRVMDGILREELGFEGVAITDALDMGALPQDATQGIDVIVALRAGVDLLLATAKRPARRRIEAALARAADLDLVEPAALARSTARIEALKRWIAGFPDPDIAVVASPDHLALARELAERSLTLVRDDGLLPLRLSARDRVLAVMPRPRDLTPADTSSYVEPGLAVAFRAHHSTVDEIVIEGPPTSAEIVAIRARAADAAVVVIGTIAAAPGSPQAALVEALIGTERPLVTVALRTPWDLASYPAATTHICTYSILPDAMEALARALFGPPVPEAFPGRLPVDAAWAAHVRAAR